MDNAKTSAPQIELMQPLLRWQISQANGFETLGYLQSVSDFLQFLVVSG